MPAGLLSAQAIAFMLVFARVGAMIMVAPAIGDEQIPARLRLMLALAVTVVLLPVVLLNLPPTPQSEPALLGLLLGEILTGVVLGGAARILMSALQVAGTIIAIQSGLAVATAYDPNQGIQSAAVARLLGVLGVVLLFQMNLHHLFLSGLVRSYALFAPGGPIMAKDLSDLVVMLVGNAFALGVQIAAPFILYGILLNVGLGIMARLVPSLQVFFIAQPLSLLLSFLLWTFTIGLMMQLFVDRFQSMLHRIYGG